MLSHTMLYSQATGFSLSSAKDLNTTLNENSGLEYCRGKLWTHNDSGSGPKIYSINPNDGSILQTITLEGITNKDWEDLAADGYYLYIADTGNNSNGARTDLVIYKINLDDIPLMNDATIPNNKIDSIRFYYPEQGLTPTPVASNETEYDCEAILIRNDIIHLFTKDWTSASYGYGTTEYLLPNIPHPTGDKYPAKLFHRHDNIGFLVTGADNAGVNQVVLVGYQNVVPGDHYVRVYSGFQGDDISSGKIYPTRLGTALEFGQVEAVCFGENPFEGYISNEKFEQYVSLIPMTITIPAKVKPFTISYNNAADTTQITTGSAGGGIQGNIRYNSKRKHIEGFNGLYWIPLVVQ
ncbi:MAG: hypothetical protein LBR97_04445 [Dysgonamonadaceae bacterium]|nr:hypothetical protein [Dysgonamonadaceae bacterium]